MEVCVAIVCQAFQMVLNTLNRRLLTHSQNRRMKLNMHTPHHQAPHNNSTLSTINAVQRRPDKVLDQSLRILDPWYPHSYMYKVLAPSPMILKQPCSLPAAWYIGILTDSPPFGPSLCIPSSTSHRRFFSGLLWYLPCHCRHVSVSQSLQFCPLHLPG